ncbi:hypothetical protein G9A89_020605 [Geosiphon pyriformis]|nr:hypothetical protein G9A89_020605 [Geosiphon pyriformis]
MPLVFSEDSLDTISKSCVVIQPKNVSDTSTSKGNGSHFESSGFQNLLAGAEPTEALKLRHCDCYRNLSEIQSKVDNALLNVNQSSIDELTFFVNSAYTSLEGANIHGFTLPSREIPAALLFAGINIPDHEMLFSQIAQRLRQQESNHVAVLQSKDCVNMKSLMKSLSDQIIDFNPDFENEEDQMEEMTFSIREQADTCLPKYDIEVLAQWFENKCDKQQQNYQDQTPQQKIVILIQDSEAFEPSLLEDLIYSCSNYQDRLAVVLLIGVATTIESFQKALSKSILGLLRIEKIHMQKPEKSLNEIVSELLVENPHGIKLAQGPYKLLHNIFLLHNYSVASFVSKFKYAVMHHFYANPLSILAGIESDEVKKRLPLLSKNHLENIRMQQSFRRYVEQRLSNTNEVRSLLKDDDYLKNLLPDIVHTIGLYHKKFAIAFEFVWLLQQSFDHRFAISRKPKHLLYYLALREEEGLRSAYHIKDLLENLKKLDSTSLSNFLHNCSNYLSTNPYATLCVTDEISLIVDFSTRLFAIEQQYAEENKAEQNSSRSSNIDQSSKHPGLLSAFAHQSSRATNVAKKNLIDGAIGSVKNYTSLVAEISQFFDNIFDAYLKHYSTIMLHEIVYYDVTKLLKNGFTVQPRTAIQSGLGHPRHYINCDCCHYEDDEDDIDQILPTEQDTCILYKLYLECGKMINMYDWLVAFRSIIEKKELIGESEAQARFIRSVGELQLLGFVKPTARKTDHFERLTWGH